MPSPRESSAIWDYVVIGSTVLPPDGVNGHVVVKVSPKIKDDKKSPSGANGGRNTTHGLDLAEVKIELVFQDAPGAYDRVAAAIQAFWPPRGAEGIAHGATDLWNVRDVEIRSCEGPEWDEGKGSISIDAREWRPASPKAIGGGGGGGPGADILAKLAAAKAKLAAAKAKNIQDPAEIATLEKEIKSLEILAANNSATKTSTASDPTKQWSKGGLPLGEIQPGTPGMPLGEIQP